MSTRGTKIKVGFQPANAPVAVAGASLAQDVALGGAAPETGATPINRATTTLSDLCNSSFGRKRAKRRKADVSTAAEVAASKAKHKEASVQRARAMAAVEQPKSAGPQVEIVNGKIVVRESSLVVNQGSSAPVDYEEIEEGIHPTATYSSFSKRIYSSPWGIEETRRFYESLRMCGTDFSMLQVFFPGRTRQQLKSKFFREEKEHPELVKCALDRRLPLDLSPFEIHMTGLTETVARGIDDIGYVVASDTSTSASVKRKRTRSGSKDPRNECSDKGDSDISAVNVRSNTRLENLLSTGTIDTDSSDNEDGLIEV